MLLCVSDWMAQTGSYVHGCVCEFLFLEILDMVLDLNSSVILLLRNQVWKIEWEFKTVIWINSPSVFH